MVAALTVRLIVLPIGLLDTVPLWIRILICVISVSIMLSKPQQRLVPALLIGTLLMASYGFMR
jgi:hypothetical protein